LYLTKDFINLYKIFEIWAYFGIFRVLGLKEKILKGYFFEC